MKFRDAHLMFTSLCKRATTDMLVIHHSNGGNDVDFSAERIHAMHLNVGYSGAGYHFVIRKDGTVEAARPEWAVGAHAVGENYHTIGICLSGDFSIAMPTCEQIDSLAELIHDLCRDYHIPCDRQHIVGHCDLMSTDCPGHGVYSQLDDIINRAQSDNPPTYTGIPVENIFDLARRYESNGDPAAIGYGYGLYQFNKKTVKYFVEWLKIYPDDKLANYGKTLADANNFDGTWQMLGTVDPGHFSQLQDEFAKAQYFDEIERLLDKEGFHLKNHSINLQAVIFARAIQHGVFGCLELLKRSCTYPNLSYIDDMSFDRTFISNIYDYLIKNPAYGLAVDKLNDALRNRFIKEKADALA